MPGNVAPKNALNKSLLDSLNLERNGISLTILKSSIDSDPDSYFLHGSVHLMRWEIHDLQDQLTSLSANTEKRKKYLQIFTWRTILDCVEVRNR